MRKEIFLTSDLEINVLVWSEVHSEGEQLISPLLLIQLTIAWERYSKQTTSGISDLLKPILQYKQATYRYNPYNPL